MRLICTALTLLALTVTACGGNGPDYDTADDVAAMIEDAGLTVTNPHPDRTMSGASSELEARIESQPARVLLFPDRQARDSWVALSQGFGALAVTRGDEPWAIGIHTTLDDDLSDDIDHAQTIADALNGEVR